MEINLLAQRVKALIQRVDDAGLPGFISVEEVDALTQGSDLKKVRVTLNEVLAALHEILYTPPPRR